MAVMVSALLPRSNARFPAASSIQDQSKRKLIRGGREIRAPASLLGAHVGDGADGGAGVRNCDGACGGVGSVIRHRCSGKTEIENLHPALARHENVVRLQIAMNNSGGVRGRHTIRDLYREIE